MEDGVIEGEAQLQGVRVAERLSSLSGGFFVRSQCFLGDCGALIAGGKLGDVAQEVRLHLEEEDLGLVTVRVGDEAIFDKVKDVLARAR